MLELIVISALVAIYTGHWLLKKRKLGAMADTVPSGLVKSYLSELIQEAHVIRSQLFGMVSGADLDAAALRLGNPPAVLTALQGTAPQGTAAGVSSADLEKLHDLEAKLGEQNEFIKKVETEKVTLQQEIEALKSQKTTDAKDSSAQEDLRKKIKELEERLAEYSVIEDDLANLKKLQQENKQLRDALQTKGIPLPDVGAPTVEEKQEKAKAEAAKETAAPATISKEEEAFAALAKETEKSVKAASASAAAAIASPAPPTAATPTPAAVSVSASAAPTPAAATTSTAATKEKEAPAASTETSATASPAAVPSTSTTAAPTADGDKQKTDDDLLAEFERMLNG